MQPKSCCWGLANWNKEVLIALQRLGVETIEDRYDNAPGQQVAHHAHTITMSDPRQLKALEVAGMVRVMSSSGKGQSKIDGPPDVQKEKSPRPPVKTASAVT